MRTQLLCLVGILSLLASASPVQHEPVIHERRDFLSKWAKTTRLRHDTELPVRISLTQRNIGHGEVSLLALSDPLSADYGKHWTSDQVKDTFAPSDTTVQSTMDWLADGGISRGRIQKTTSVGALAFTATVKELENLLRADYYLYEHLDMEDAAIGCDEYHIPAYLQSHIDFISPGVGLEGRRKGHADMIRKRDETCTTNGPITLGFKPFSELPKSFPLDKCSEGITPGCIQALYSVPDNAACHPDSSVGIFSLEASFVQEDLDKFFNSFPSKVPSGTQPEFVSINGANASDKIRSVLDFEANLDVQMVLPLVYPQNVSFYSVGPSEKQLDLLNHLNLSSPTAPTLVDVTCFNDLLSAFDKSYCDNSTGTECGTLQAPKVLSISYGPPELFAPEAMAKRLCNEFMKLGLQGTTVLASSGDGGLSPQLGPGQCYGPENKIFNPSVLASCPWVTAVGGTQLAANSSVSSPGGEVVANQSAPGLSNYSPGSGFSNYYAVPAYQKAAVDGYFKQHPSPYPSYHYNGSTSSIGANGGLYNAGGRAYPDVSTLSANIYTVASGCWGLDGGTSYASPIFAGIISRLNSERLEAGKSTLGFLNPILYSHPEVLNDITTGHNYGCGTEGFPAAKGWDIVTGLGTPNYPKMKDLVMSLP